MQAYSPFNPVGAQHNYSSVFSAFSKIVAAEGPKGLVRGMDAAMLRTAAGSSVQLPAYGVAKAKLEQWGVPDGIGMFLLSSTFSGACVCLVMQPFGAFAPHSRRLEWLRMLTDDFCTDTALTRMYNQSPNSIGPDGKPRGLLCESSDGSARPLRRNSTSIATHPNDHSANFLRPPCSQTRTR